MNQLLIIKFAAKTALYLIIFLCNCSYVSTLCFYFFWSAEIFC